MYRHTLLVLLIALNGLWGSSSQEIRVDVPEVVYIQWLDDERDRMSFEQTSDIANFPAYQNTYVDEVEVQSIYLGVMCNSLSGYQVQIEAMDAADSETIAAVAPNGTNVRVKLRLSAVSHSMRGGTRASVSLDVTGFSPSISTSFSGPHDLPLSPREPNLYRLDAHFQKFSKRPYSEYIDFYVGRVMGTVYLQ